MLVILLFVNIIFPFKIKETNGELQATSNEPTNYKQLQINLQITKAKLKKQI